MRHLARASGRISSKTLGENLGRVLTKEAIADSKIWLTKSQKKTIQNLLVGMTYLALLMSTGCVQIVDKDEKKSAPETPVRIKQNAKSLYNEWFIEKDFYRIRGVDQKPNQFIVQIKKNVAIADIQPKISMPVAIMTDEQSLSYQVMGGSKLILSTPQGLVEAIVPQDLELNSYQIVGSESEMVFKTSGRIFVGPRANLISREKKITLIAHEILFKKAILQNFLSTDQASADTEGASGGQIILVAPKISGHLYVELRGQKGGTGVRGAERTDYGVDPLKTGDKGGRGRNGGDTGNLVIISNHTEELDLDLQFYPGLGGEGGLGGVGQYRVMDNTANNRGPLGPTGETGKSGKKGYLCLASAPNENPECFDPNLSE